MAKQKFSDGNKQKKKQKNKLKKDRYRSKDVGKRGRIIVRNLPYSCTEDKLSEVFGEFGKIVDISLPRHADNDKPKGFGFVDFNSRLSADKATEALSGKYFMGRKISIERAVSKDRFVNSITKNGNSGFGKEVEKVEEEEEDDEEDDSGVVEDEEHYEDKKDIKIKEEKVDTDVIETVKKEPKEKKKKSKKDRASDISASADDDKNENVKNTKEKKPHEIPKKKKARIIVRNLPFKTTEESLRKHFSTFGGIIDLNLLRRIDNKLVGCAFIEFNNRKSAVKAIVSASGKPFLGRTIVADWAVPVKDFRKANDGNVSIKKEITSEDESDSSSEESDSKKNKTEEVISSDEDDDDMEEDEVDDEDDDDQEEEEESESDEDEDSREVSKNKNKRKSDEPIDSNEQKKPRFESHDVSEGRTVFIKNVPFTATNDDLKECVKQFGPIFYALVCVDPVTEHSRGTAFVKFKNEEDAAKCLSAGTSFTLNGTVLDPHPAIDRDKLKEMKSKKTENKDSRNLYLIKEGVVLASTPAAAGVSVADMSRRLQLEQWKTQMLKNLNMFVSKNRLIIHNLPPTYDDKKLKQLFMKYSKPNAVITETRVMRDLKNVDGKGVGRSKEFGFISYKEHEDALHALRNINNNPKIFTESKRPIVAFSIENKRITNLKAKRLERSKMNNPLCPGYKPQNNNQANNKTENDNNTQKKGKKNRKKENKNKRQNNTEAETNDSEYVGFTAEPGSTSLRSKYKLKVQAETHQTNVKKMKKENKTFVKPKPIRAVENNRNEKTIKLKKKKTIEDDSHFTSLVNKYKTQLMSDTVRKKWYE